MRVYVPATERLASKEAEEPQNSQQQAWAENYQDQAFDCEQALVHAAHGVGLGSGFHKFVMRVSRNAPDCHYVGVDVTTQRLYNKCRHLGSLLTLPWCLFTKPVISREATA